MTDEMRSAIEQRTQAGTANEQRLTLKCNALTQERDRLRLEVDRLTRELREARARP